MDIKLNKTIKNQIVLAALRATFKPQYEAAMRNLVVAARVWRVKNSLHDEAMKCSDELKRHIQTVNRVVFEHSHRFIHLVVSFELQGKSRTYVDEVHLDDPVYASHGGYLPDDFPEYVALVKVIKEADDFYSTATAAIGAYTKAEKMFEDLQWTKTYYPEQISTCTALVDTATLERLNKVVSGEPQA